jgi:hypothetical protein
MDKRRKQRLTPQQQIEHDQRILDDFNTQFPVGSRVWFQKWLGFGPVCETTVRAAAFIADSGQSVCFLQGISGYVSVWHVQPIDESRRQDLTFASGEGEGARHAENGEESGT